MSSAAASFRSMSPETKPTPTFSFNKRRSTRSNDTWNRTTYALAYPAPVFMDKTLLLKHLRPRLYLQFQKQSADGRHIEPYIDVVSLAAPKDPRRLLSAVRKCAKKLKKHEDQRDIVLVRSGGDEGAPDSDSDDRSEDHPHHHHHHHLGVEKALTRLEDDLTERQVAAMLRRACNVLVTEDGRTWRVSTRPSGALEFTYVGEHGEVTVARWVPARGHHRVAPLGPGSPRTSSVAASYSEESSSSSSSSSGAGVAFKFSLIVPGLRRHAVLATLDPQNLSVKHSYSDPVSAADEKPGDGTPKIVDRDTRTLILASAVWLCLHEGWSPAYEASR